MKDLERESALRSIVDQVEYLRSELGYGRAKLRRTSSASPRIRAAGGGAGSGGAGGPSDPTGGSVEDASTQAERSGERMDNWDEMIDHALDLLAKVALDVDKVLRPPAEAAPKQLPLRGCISCARDGGYFEPIHEAKYSEYCRRCGDFKAAEGRVPPLGAVEDFHRTGRRWTTKVIRDALEAERRRAIAGSPRRRSA